MHANPPHLQLCGVDTQPPHLLELDDVQQGFVCTQPSHLLELDDMQRGAKACPPWRGQWVGPDVCSSASRGNVSSSRLQFFIPSFIYPFLLYFIHSFAHSSIPWFVHPFLHSFLPSFLHSDLPDPARSAVPARTCTQKGWGLSSTGAQGTKVLR